MTIDFCETAEEEGTEILVNFVPITDKGVKIARIPHNPFPIDTATVRYQNSGNRIGGIPQQADQCK
jgi:hypothetical protein